MKIAQVMGRGIEGAGVTRYVIELNNYLNKNNIYNQVFVVTDKKWGREKSQSFPSYKEIDENNINETIKLLNDFDLVFIHSVPSIKHSQKIIDEFFRLVKELKSKKIIFQNDHKIQSIYRNANFFEICKECDKIVSHSITSPFYKKLISLFGDEIKQKYVHLHVMYNFDQLSKYRKENHEKKISYLGRFATFKDPGRLLKIVDECKHNNINLEMIGVERSLGALTIFYEDIDKRIPHSKIIEVNKKFLENNGDLKNRDLSKVYVWGPYIYNEGITQLSNSIVGCDFYHLDEFAYGDNVEYAQCEIVGVGCVPLFDYHWSINCNAYELGKNTNIKFNEIENFGLFLKKDCSNINEVIDKINEIYSNKNLHRKYLDTSLNVLKSHCDIDYVCKTLIDDVSNDDKKVFEKQEDIFSLGMGF